VGLIGLCYARKNRFYARSVRIKPAPGLELWPQSSDDRRSNATLTFRSKLFQLTASTEL